MAIVFDAVTLIIILISVIICIKRGFVESLFKSLGFITAVFCALILTTVLSSFLKAAFVEDLSYTFVRGVVCKTEDGSGFDNVVVDIAQKNPELCSALEHVGVDVAEIERYATELDGENKEEAMELLVKKIATPMSNLISDVTAFLASYTVIYLLIKLLSWLLEAFVKLPVVRNVNHTLGAGYGLVLGSVRAGFFIMIVAAAYPIIGAYFPSIPTMESVASQTVIFKFIANNNILSLIINTFI